MSLLRRLVIGNVQPQRCLLTSNSPQFFFGCRLDNTLLDAPVGADLQRSPVKLALADFAFCKRGAPSQGLRRTRTHLGTAPFMAPGWWLMFVTQMHCSRRLPSLAASPTAASAAPLHAAGGRWGAEGH